ncbi:uncharacterized protein Z518_11380 [Rhinocladiella mackenziei CBS 650.93]|uniref:Rhinocladiella mackenziei CBS 650.93 unplaced genomic scaffold supercont1.13, whole genome shotgun sequence n=1 Tax=Rhinocladiella mackenziei CBS 650.93 TaxID=1442369 RepID=A0A0D2GLY0_9EURO|nr:uncharacterized protein Z518_11380 [Rhinocladiella mackenziei CBS 650.93]KIW99392.1 hypothetical protein Z518_11380 [Rhinocladiella mackenziei CBS 650.93]
MTISSPSLFLDAIQQSSDWAAFASGPEAVQGRHTQIIVPIAPNGETKNKEEVSKRKQPKSRNAFSRMCNVQGEEDEVRRNEAGLKLEDLRKVENGTHLTEERLEAAPPPTNLLLSGKLDSVVEDVAGAALQDTIIPSSQPRASSRSRSSPDILLPMSPSFILNHHMIPLPGPPKLAYPDHKAECIFDDVDIGIFDRRQLDENTLPNPFPDQSLNLDDLDLPLSATAMEATFHDHQSPHLADLVLPTQVTAANTHENLGRHIYNSEAVIESGEAVHEENVEESSWQMTDFDPIVETSTQPLESPPPSSGPAAGKDLLPWYQQLRPPIVTQEMIRHLFDLKTCDILSIKDDRTENPWKTLVWPLAHNCPALYHALAAMTCLHLCRTQTELRVQGIRHFQRSMEVLADNEDNGNIPLASALATRLALGFAESWDHQKSSTGIDHINIAKKLVRQAVSKHQTSKLVAGELSRLSFLANTWMYMDVIARFTCTDDESSTDFEFMTACILLSPVPREQQIDPLMGCAITLFPMIGRLADLVGRVRRRTEKRNSLAIISKAIDLRIAIEHWIPPIDLEKFEDPKSNISDSIQTAEAYRWAALLMLRQAVPELPWSQSMWELAQKALVFLATIPLTSRKTIVQIFPLMAAGCEAFEEEDRHWVRERWDLMSKRMITGIVDRCKEVTSEVWRRRDEYAASHESCHISRAINSQNGLDPTVKNSSSGCRCSPGGRTPSHSSDFPESVAFKKGIDPLTRAGNIKYTVKGDLHWLGVMKDWGWEVMLG